MAERKNWEFLLQQEGDRTWLPLESPDVEILEGRYRVLVRSNLKNADIEVRITHEATEEDPPKRRTQRRNQRTSPEGLMVVIPFTLLQPGIWELDCSSGVMTDLLGSSCQYSVQLHVLPRESENEGDWDPDWSLPVEEARDRAAEGPSQGGDRDSIVGATGAIESVPAEAALIDRPHETLTEDESPEATLEDWIHDHPVMESEPPEEVPAFGSTLADWIHDHPVSPEVFLPESAPIEPEVSSADLTDLEGLPEPADPSDASAETSLEIYEDWDEDTLLSSLGLPILDAEMEPAHPPMAEVTAQPEDLSPELGWLEEDLESETIAAVADPTEALEPSWLAALDDQEDWTIELPEELLGEPARSEDAADLLGDRAGEAALAIDDDEWVVGRDLLGDAEPTADRPRDWSREEAFAIEDALPAIDLVLYPDAYEIHTGQPLILTGQVRSQAAVVPALVLQAGLRDPQTGQTLIEQSFELTGAAWPIDLQLTFPAPNPGSAQLLLGEANLIDPISQRILARQPFTVTADLEDVLARLTQQPLPDLEPTVEEPEPPAPSIDLAFLGLVNKAPDAPSPETQTSEQLGLTASPGQTLPPQIRASSEPIERRSIDLPGFLPPNPKVVADSIAHPTPEANEDLLDLFDETPIEAAATDWLAELEGGDATDRPAPGDLPIAEPSSLDREIPSDVIPSDIISSDSSPEVVSNLPPDLLRELEPELQPEGMPEETGWAFDRELPAPSIEFIEPPEDFLAEFNAELTSSGAALPLEDDFETVLTEDLFSPAPIGADASEFTDDLPLEFDLELEEDEAVHTIDVEAATLPDPFEALNLETRFMDRLSSLAEDTQAQEAAQLSPTPPEPVNPFVTPPLEIASDLSESVVMDDALQFVLPSIGSDEPENPLKLADDQPVPMPILEVEDRAEVMAGQPLLVRVKLPSVLPKLYVKLWINDRQTRTLLDGPRYLVDFVPNGLGDLEATTQLTVPMGSLTIQLEAVTIETATKRESYKASASLTVVPPNLPEFSLDDLGF